jgi:hypothetical protein
MCLFCSFSGLHDFFIHSLNSIRSVLVFYVTYIQMTDMSTPKQLSGDILPPPSQHSEVPVGTSTDTITGSAYNNL